MNLLMIRMILDNRCVQREKQFKTESIGIAFLLDFAPDL